MRGDAREVEVTGRRRKGPWAKECRQPLDAGKGEGMDSALEPQERKDSCRNLDTHLVKLILDLTSRTVR